MWRRSCSYSIGFAELCTAFEQPWWSLFWPSSSCICGLRMLAGAIVVRVGPSDRMAATPMVEDGKTGAMGLSALPSSRRLSALRLIMLGAAAHEKTGRAKRTRSGDATDPCHHHPVLLHHQSRTAVAGRIYPKVVLWTPDCKLSLKHSAKKRQTGMLKLKKKLSWPKYVLLLQKGWGVRLWKPVPRSTCQMGLWHWETPKISSHHLIAWQFFTHWMGMRKSKRPWHGWSLRKLWPVRRKVCWKSFTERCAAAVGLPDRNLQWRTSSCRAWRMRLLNFQLLDGDDAVGLCEGRNTARSDLPLPPSLPFFGSWVGVFIVSATGCCAFICGVSFGASQCSTGALGQIWPIPYLSALKTIAFDYPVTNAILANTFGYDAGYMARALCLSAACTGFLMRRPLLDYGFGWKQLQSRSLLFSGHNASTPFPCTNLLVRRPFCEHWRCCQFGLFKEIWCRDIHC